jgi:hypothetical protein
MHEFRDLNTKTISTYDMSKLGQYLKSSYLMN